MGSKQVNNSELRVAQRRPTALKNTSVLVLSRLGTDSTKSDIMHVVNNAKQIIDTILNS